MQRELFEEMKQMAIAFVLVFLTFKIAFFGEDIVSLLRIVSSLFYLFVLPGYFILRLYGEKLSFIEKVVMGTLLSAAIIGIFSYYLGIVGLNIKYHQFILPPLMIAFGIYFELKGYSIKKENNQKDEHNSAQT